MDGGSFSGSGGISIPPELVGSVDSIAACVARISALVNKKGIETQGSKLKTIHWSCGMEYHKVMQ
jgi:hypothetical protein